MDPALCSEFLAFLRPGVRADVKSQALEYVLGRLTDPHYVYADSVCTVLCNLSREEASCRAVITALTDRGLNKLLEMICSPHYNAAAALHYLGPLMCNLTQLPEGRSFILDRSRIPKLFSSKDVHPFLLIHVGTNDTARKDLPTICKDFEELGKKVKELDAQPQPSKTTWAPDVRNLTQLPEGRSFILDRSK
ncbi:unnamed protein product [Ranitomeya imitator]|uniref:Protein HGH1 N-terminal domain-containing protein n=1 Tax=Ranitomeya imitator TaxID=111125 RepID=A0ABN9MQQ1_9NEOB|nr:unnamed protein product [Ranitomeya imitator]